MASHERKFPLTVIDDFFDEPEDVYEIAQSCAYKTPGATNYPGTVAVEKLAVTHPDLCAWTLSKILPLFWETRNSSVKWHANIEFQKIDPGPLATGSGRELPGIVHMDSDRCLFAGVIYLNPDFQPDSGTSFYELKKGHQFYQVSEELLETARALHSGADVHDQYERLLQTHHENFIETARIQARFNRLCLYSPASWHGQTSFGMGRPRLTLRMFVSNSSRKSAR
jgi:hypothetical protein